jgi:hypothetical protein
LSNHELPLDQGSLVGAAVVVVVVVVVILVVLVLAAGSGCPGLKTVGAYSGGKR